MLGRHLTDERGARSSDGAHLSEPLRSEGLYEGEGEGGGEGEDVEGWRRHISAG